MVRLPAFAALLFLLPLGATPIAPAAGDGPQLNSDGPHFNSDGTLQLPKQYREWVFLTSGLDMSYDRTAANPNMSMFNNVFVNAAAYRAFLASGHWPEGTAIVLENRGAAGNQSINRRGKTQSVELMGLEVHVKDSAHIHAPGGWGFYSFDGNGPAKRIEQSANCYSCHEQHGAVDTTFVQFYPTLQPAAKQYATYSKAYLHAQEVEVK